MVIGRHWWGLMPARAVYKASLPTGMPMPQAPKSPRPRIRSPSVTTIALTSGSGLQQFSFMLSKVYLNNVKLHRFLHTYLKIYKKKIYQYLTSTRFYTYFLIVSYVPSGIFELFILGYLGKIYSTFLPQPPPHKKKQFPLGWSGAELISGVSFMKMLTVTDVNCFV